MEGGGYTPASGGPIAPTLGALTLSTSTFEEGAAPMTVIGVVMGRTVGSSLSVIDSRFVIDGSGNLRVGLSVSVAGTISLTIYETLDGATGSPKATTVTLTCGTMSALNPFTDPTISPYIMVGISSRKMNPSYAGNCCAVRDSALGPRNFPFNGTTGVLDFAAGAAWGDGATFTASAVLDQSVNARAMFTSTQRVTVVPQAYQRADLSYVPGFDFVTKSQYLYTNTGFLDIGGTANLAIFGVFGTYGWSSAGTHARNPAVNSGAGGPVLGYGTAANGALIYGASAGTSPAPGETLMYGTADLLAVEDGTPDNTRIRNIAFNQKGSVVSGFNGDVCCFTDRVHGRAAEFAQRVVFGSNGVPAQSHNGPIFEFIIIQMPAGQELTDIQAQRIIKWQRQFWNNHGTGHVASNRNQNTRYRFHGAGQSLMQYFGTAASASTGLSADFADVRVVIPTLAGLIGDVIGYGGVTNRLTVTFNTTAYGGSSLYPASQLTPDGPGGTSWLIYDGSTLPKKFWWDHYNGIPGPCLVGWLAGALPSALGNPMYDNFAMMWAHGEANAGEWDASGFNANASLYKTTLQTIWNYMWTKQGTTFPIIIQPIGRQNGSDTGMRAIRKIQLELATEMANIFVSAETTHMTRQDNVHFGAGPADPNGFDRAGIQLARTMAVAVGKTGIVWRGPHITAAKVVNATTLDLTIAYPSGSGGTDIQTVDGSTTGMVGFEVTGKTVTSAARTSATNIRLTGTGFAVGDKVQYNPVPAALDRLKMVVDNYATINMPLRQAFDLIAT
jgi:hypothetical protein